MSCLIDTNVIVRIADKGSPENPIAHAAVERLLADGEAVYISVQILVEFWAVATRPEEVNGLGWPTSAAAKAVRALIGQFPVLDESPQVLDRWLDLVEHRHVSGKRVHDARLAALALANGIDRLLTFNTSDFPSSWGVDAVDPSSLASGSQS